MKTKSIHFHGGMAVWILVTILLSASAPYRQAVDTSPPQQVVKLVFIHHSTGENWLADGYGDLGQTLGENNYFVSDTNYGWGPEAVGDRTDIPNWVEWFASENTSVYMQALFNESEILVQIAFGEQHRLSAFGRRGDDREHKVIFAGVQSRDQTRELGAFDLELLAEAAREFVTEIDIKALDLPAQRAHGMGREGGIDSGSQSLRGRGRGGQRGQDQAKA